MTVYLISEVEMLDDELGNRYRELAAAAIEAHGGRYLARGARPAVLEGEWNPAERVVIVEFDSAEAAGAWYASPEYAAALSVRQTALRRRLLLVEGVSP